MGPWDHPWITQEQLEAHRAGLEATESELQNSSSSGLTCPECGDTEWIKDVYGNPPKCGKCSVIAEPLIGERYCFDEHG